MPQIVTISLTFQWDQISGMPRKPYLTLQGGTPTALQHIRTALHDITAHHSTLQCITVHNNDAKAPRKRARNLDFACKSTEKESTQSAELTDGRSAELGSG